MVMMNNMVYDLIFKYYEIIITIFNFLMFIKEWCLYICSIFYKINKMINNIRSFINSLKMKILTLFIDKNQEKDWLFLKDTELLEKEEKDCLYLKDQELLEWKKDQIAKLKKGQKEWEDEIVKWKKGQKEWEYEWSKELDKCDYDKKTYEFEDDFQNDRNFVPIIFTEKESLILSGQNDVSIINDYEDDFQMVIISPILGIHVLN